MAVPNRLMGVVCVSLRFCQAIVCLGVVAAIRDDASDDPRGGRAGDRCSAGDRSARCSIDAVFKSLTIYIVLLRHHQGDLVRRRLEAHLDPYEERQIGSGQHQQDDERCHQRELDCSHAATGSDRPIGSMGMVH